MVDPLAVEGVDETTQRQVIEELTAAIATLRNRSVEITTEMVEDGEPRSAVARVDVGEQLLESSLVAQLAGGSEVNTRHVIVDGRAFLKSTTSAEAEAALDFTELPFDPIGAELLDEAFAGYGRIDKSLDRISFCWRTCPFAAQITPLENGTEISVVMSPRSQSRSTTPHPVSKPSAVQSLLSAPNSPFASKTASSAVVVAGGTHFHDGEARRRLRHPIVLHPESIPSTLAATRASIVRGAVKRRLRPRCSYDR